MSRYSSSDCKVYIGDLGTAGNKNEIEDAFAEYGKLRSVWVARNPPGFAFVEFEDPRDAEDAVRGLDGRSLCGRRVRVELSTGRKRDRGNDRSGPARGGRGPPRSEERCYECGERGHFARDCRRRNYRGRSRSRSRSRSRRSRSRSESRSKSRSASRDKRSPASRSRSRSRSGSRNGDE